MDRGFFIRYTEYGRIRYPIFYRNDFLPIQCILNGKITNGGKGYVRFPDGTQICYGTLSSTGYTSVNHNLFFAKPFIDTEYVVILTKGTNGKFITEFGEYDSSGNRNRSVDKCSVHYDATTANYTKTISWVAIGRWK